MGFKWWGDEFIDDGWVSAAGFSFILGCSIVFFYCLVFDM